jgi:uncharacterized protein YodC (DUF2158 family)
MTQLKPGDVVKLKIGAPPMTVVKATDKGVLCCWFVLGQSLPESFEFIEAVLEPTQAPEDNTIRR